MPISRSLNFKKGTLKNLMNGTSSRNHQISHATGSLPTESAAAANMKAAADMKAAGTMRQGSEPPYFTSMPDYLLPVHHKEFVLKENQTDLKSEEA